MRCNLCGHDDTAGWIGPGMTLGHRPERTALRNYDPVRRWPPGPTPLFLR
jgi:hypothetical protein